MPQDVAFDRTAGFPGQAGKTESATENKPPRSDAQAFLLQGKGEKVV